MTRGVSVKEGTNFQHLGKRACLWKQSVLWIQTRRTFTCLLWEWMWKHMEMESFTKCFVFGFCTAGARAGFSVQWALDCIWAFFSSFFFFAQTIVFIMWTAPGDTEEVCSQVWNSWNWSLSEATIHIQLRLGMSQMEHLKWSASFRDYLLSISGRMEQHPLWKSLVWCGMKWVKVVDFILSNE